eukprot:2672409-Rhodomonas_salina.1
MAAVSWVRSPRVTRGWGAMPALDTRSKPLLCSARRILLELMIQVIVHTSRPWQRCRVGRSRSHP